MPTISPGWMLSGTICSRDSSTRMGSPAAAGVAAARTNSHLGVITAVPKELSLGLTKCTRVKDRPFQVQARLEEAHRDRTSFAELVNAPWQGTRRQWPAMSSIIHTKSDSKTEIRVFL